jgi:sodium-dependent phosphate cotransporter
LVFNVTGIIIWYPIPFMRNVPLHGARQLGKATRIWRGFPLVYVLVVFLLIPAALMGLSALFEQKTKGWTVLGSFLTILIALALGYTGYWCHFKDGKHKITQCFAERQRRREVMESLPDDMEYLKAKITALVDHTGLPEEEEDIDVEAEAEATKTDSVEKEEQNSAATDEDAKEIHT